MCASAFLLTATPSLMAAGLYNESGGTVIMEAENTSSDLDLWAPSTTLGGYTGASYLEFSGNNVASGPPASPLVFEFKINQAGLYYLHLHAARVNVTLNGNIRTDVANDCYVRVEGKYSAGPNAGDDHQDDATLSLLERNTKFFMSGRDKSFAWSPGSDTTKGRLDPGGHANKRVAVYDFKAGETYKLVVSGRSQLFKLDRVMFRHIDADYATSTALDNPESSPVSKEAKTTVLNATTDFTDILGGGAPYYVDKTRGALAINASREADRGKFARASIIHSSGAGNYDVTIAALQELDGESTYRLLVDGVIVGTATNAPTTQDYTPQNHTFSNISIPAESTISVESNSVTNGQIPEGNGTAYARGRWTTLTLSPHGSTAVSAPVIDGLPTITGQLRQWHEVVLSFAGPSTSETATPNPFTDYRLDVTFTHPVSGDSFTVPGYFAADGNAAVTHADAGNIWRAHFAPPQVGDWNYSVSFRRGTDVAISEIAGTPVAPIDGTSGSFRILASDKTGNDFRAPGRGLLRNRGGHHLTFQSGGHWLKAGVNIPENFMGYSGFDNTPPTGNNFPTRTWAAHIQDWNPGDPDWDSPNQVGNTDGRGIIGAFNYLADQGSNSMYFIAMNVKGDTNETFPTVAPFDKEHYDISKLDQWNIVLTHANSLGINVNCILGETENGNENYHDGGTLGRQRKLYYRMMVARFGHLLALEWGVGEESDFGAAKNLQFADYIKSVDSYGHPVSVETRGNKFHQQYDNIIGSESFDSAAFQGGTARTNMQDLILEWKGLTAGTGVPWVMNYQEPQSIEHDLDDEVKGLPRGRRDMMWPLFMSAGAGFEWYVQEDGGITGERDPVSGKLIGHRLDLMLADLRLLEKPIQWNGHALRFFGPLPITEMTPSYSSSDGTTTYVLAKAGEQYAVYNDRKGTGLTLDLREVPGDFGVRWFDPRNGGAFQSGSTDTVSGGSVVSLGDSPSTPGEDWAVLVTKLATPISED